MPPTLNELSWLGRQDSNLRMPVPKTGALPLGDAPSHRLNGRLAAFIEEGKGLAAGNALCDPYKNHAPSVLKRWGC